MTWRVIDDINGPSVVTFYKPVTSIHNIPSILSAYHPPHQFVTRIFHHPDKMETSIIVCQTNASPKTHSDFRPISVTSVFTRNMEHVVSRFLYPAFITAPPTLSIEDQYAFCPAGSTSAAPAPLFHTIAQMLTTNSYVIVLCLDFSEAFDTV